MEGLPGGEGERVRVRLPALHMELASSVLGNWPVMCKHVGGWREEGEEKESNKEKGRRETNRKAGKRQSQMELLTAAWLIMLIPQL